MKLTLVVNNTAELEGSTKAIVVFDRVGGVIGTDPQTDWLLTDRQKTVSPRHARVFFSDDQFCIEAMSEAGMIVNGGARPVKPGEPFQVQDGDTLRIGRFDILAYVSSQVDEQDGLSHGERWANRFVSVETLVGQQAQGMDGQPGNLLDASLVRRDGRISLQDRIEAKRQIDPVELLQEESGSSSPTLKDPVAALELELKPEKHGMTSNLNDYLGAALEEHGHGATPDDHQPTSAYFSPQTPRIPAERQLESGRGNASDQPTDAYLASLERRIPAQYGSEAEPHRDAYVRDSWLGEIDADDTSEELVDHVLLRPLCHALGLPIRDMKVPEANQLARDVGAALRSAVSGLMELNKAEMSSRSLLAETHLHAIEDNPLRLAESPDEAMQDLFLVRSPVHLSASAAVSESLKMLGHHQDACEKAIEAALDAVLRALAPVALARRFMKYKGHAPRAGDLDAWHWGMYQHYYSELSSGRQGGLSRMFWEVFRQVYDREMRARTVES